METKSGKYISTEVIIVDDEALVLSSVYPAIVVLGMQRSKFPKSF
jgi:hypothetical protein